MELLFRALGREVLIENNTITEDKFRAMIINNNLFPLIEEKLMLLNNSQEEYEETYNWLKENQIELTELLKDRLKSARCLSTQWKERITRFSYLLNNKEFSFICTIILLIVAMYMMYKILFINTSILLQTNELKRLFPNQLNFIT